MARAANRWRPRHPSGRRRGHSRGDATNADTEGNDQGRTSKPGAATPDRQATKATETAPRKDQSAERPSESGSLWMVLALPAVNADFGLLPDPSWGIGGGAGVEVRRFQALLTGW